MKEKLSITEERLQAIISEAINRFLNKEDGNACQWNPRKLRLIREGLIMTYPINEVIEIIKREINLGRIGNGIAITVLNKGQKDRLPYISNAKRIQSRNLDNINEIPIIRLIVNNFLNSDGYDEFLSLVNCCKRCGYFLSCIIINGDYAEKNISKELWIKLSNKKLYVEILFEPKFDAIVAPEDIPIKCYHICPTRSVDKICNGNGLTPHGKGRVSAHPERVYLFIWKPSDWHDIANAFSETSNDRDFTLLEVNMRNLIGKMKFRYDPNTYSPYPTAIYTEETIPSFNIKPIERYEVH